MNDLLDLYTKYVIVYFVELHTIKYIIMVEQNLNN